MGFYITSPVPATVNATQLKVGTPTTVAPITLVGETQQTLIPADATATQGRMIRAITNTHATIAAFVALGREATVTNYDYKIHPDSTIGDIPLGEELVSVISSGAATVLATYSSLVEV